MNKISKILLDTQALEIAPPGKVFWYTSGTIGPFYLNAHFLYGNRKKAEELLAFIDQNSADRTHLLTGLLARVEKNYAEQESYRTVLDALVALLTAEISTAQIDYVSGGERRDWFFSFMTARLLHKPALALFKDQTAVVIEDQNQAAPRMAVAVDLRGARVLHVADLVTEASSYVHAWLPAIQERGGQLPWAINVVDRGQGGEEILAQHGIVARHLIRLGQGFFQELGQTDYLDQPAVQKLIDYHRHPRESMKKLLEAHPEILKEALQGENLKIRERARQLIAQNPYDFEESYLGQFSQI